MSNFRDIQTLKPYRLIGVGFLGALFSIIILFASPPLSAQEVAQVDAPSEVESAQEEVVALGDELDASRDAQKESAAQAKQAKLVARTLRAELETPGFPEVARRSLLQRSVAAEVRAALALSREAALGESVQIQQANLETVRNESDGDREIRALEEAQEDERQRIEARETEAEQAAVDALAKAREMESHERDVTLRELLVRQRKAAEESLALTRSHRELMETIRATAQSRRESFAGRKGEILTRIDGFSEQPTPEERRDNIDPLFSELVRERGELRQTFSKILADRKQAEKVLDEVRNRHAQAKQRRERVQATNVSEVVTEIHQRRVEAAEAEYLVAEKLLETSREVLAERQKHYEESERRLAFYSSEIRRLLPKISNEARAEFFEISDQNIAYALAGLQEDLHHIIRDVDTTLIKPSELNLVSVDLWRWVWGLIWRTLMVLVLIRMLVPRVSTQIARGTDALLKRRFFREHAFATVRLSDVVDAAAAPLLYFLGARFLANYILPDELIAGFSALLIFRWALNAFFLYWAIVNVARAVALPRWFRRTTQNLKTRVDLLFMEAEAPSDPANDPQLKRGKKLVRSIRVVLFFWLISKYVPDAARLLVGVSIFTWTIDFVARWSLFFIIYWVLSTWKDNIAALFESLAGERMPQAVEVVNTRKDAFYGVFIIAAASVYVLGSELMRIARKYMLNTAWFRQASTLVFRAKIELRNREEDGLDEAAIANGLPQDYLDALATNAIGYARHEPGSDLSALIAGGDEFETMVQVFDGWQRAGLRGSMVVVGEPGSGKSTLLRHLYRHIESAVGAHVDGSAHAQDLSEPRAAKTQKKSPPLVWVEVDERISTEEAVLQFVADLFELPVEPGTGEAQLLKQIKALEPRVIFLNNCHGLFLRRIGGFDGLQALFNIISLSDQVHFYVLTFNVFAWSYVNRVRAQSHFFAEIIRLKPWSDKELQALIEARSEASDYRIDFSHLLRSRDPDADLSNDGALAKTARGYFRYLHEFSGGNPRLALTYWLRSLRLDDAKDPRGAVAAKKALQVSLFRRPSTVAFSKQTDAHWFVLSAIAQHGRLSAAEIAQAVHLDEGFCDLALRFFAETGVVHIDARTGQAMLTPLYYRQVLKYLAQSNFLYE